MMQPFKFKPTNLRPKLMIILILFILVPLTIFGVLFYQSSRTFTDERTSKETLQALTLVKQNVDQLLRFYESQILSIYEREDVIRQLSAEVRGEASADPARASADDSVSKFLRDFLRGKDDIESVYLFTPGRTYFADFKSSSLFIQQYREHSEWHDEINEAGGRAVLLPTYTLPPNTYNLEPTHYFIVGMQLKDVSDVLQTLGTLVVNVRINALERIVGDVKVSPNSVMMITDRDSRPIWHHDPAVYSTSLAAQPFLEDHIRRPGQVSRYLLDGRTFHVGSVASEYNDWRFLSFVPQSDIDAQTKDLKRFIVVTAIAFASLFILLAALSSQYISRPIRQMALAMKRIHNDPLEITFPSQGTDEIGMLQTAFTIMRDRINQLIAEVRTISAKEKEAEIRALQAQINPHFVYNSLDAINWMAIENNEPEISSMITALSGIMRYAIRPGEPYVYLSEEIEWAKNYAYLQKMRFEERFDIEFEVDAAVLSCKVPRLLIQPYLENSVIHGMEELLSGGWVRIKVDANAERTILRVKLEDNGKGIEPERLELIRQRRAHGIGIYNLDERLKLEFGPQFGVNLDSAHGKGTTVTIDLPWLT